jgi:hypothetical protein
LFLTDIACRNSTCPADKPRVRVQQQRRGDVGQRQTADPREQVLALGHYTEAGSKKGCV